MTRTSAARITSSRRRRVYSKFLARARVILIYWDTFGLRQQNGIVDGAPSDPFSPPDNRIFQFRIATVQSAIGLMLFFLPGHEIYICFRRNNILSLRYLRATTTDWSLFMGIVYYRLRSRTVLYRFLDPRTINNALQLTANNTSLIRFLYCDFYIVMPLWIPKQILG